MIDHIDFDKFDPVKLEEGIDLSDFNCSHRDTLGLNQFIHDEALDYQVQNLGVTYLFCDKSVIIAFITLAMGRLKGKLVPTEGDDITIRWYPSLLIGRLAVHNEHRDCGIGRYLLNWCVGYAQSLSEDIGCKFVVADTDENVRRFYEKCDFQCVKEGDNIIAFRRI